MVAQLALARTSDLGSSVAFTFTPADGGPNATHGHVTLSSEKADTKKALGMDLVFTNNVATLVLTEEQVNSLEAAGTPNEEVNFLCEIFDTNGTQLLVKAEQLDVAVNEAPVLSITNIEELDNQLEVTVNHSNPTGFAGPLNPNAAAFRIMYSKAGAAGFVDIVSVDTTNATTGTYVLLSAIDETALVNDVEIDIYAQGKSPDEKGGHRTNLTGVAGTLAKPNNLPNSPTELSVTTNISNFVPDTNYPVLFGGKWSDTGITNPATISYKIGVLNGSGDDFLNEPTTHITLSPPLVNAQNVFSVPVPKQWFDEGGDEIQIGMIVTQATTALDGNTIILSSPLAKATAFNPTLPTIVLNNNPSVSAFQGVVVGDQTFTTVATGLHTANHGLNTEFQRRDGTAWIGFPYADFTLPYAEIVTNEILRVRVRQNDPNGGAERTVYATNSIKLKQFRNPTADVFLLTGNGVDTAPTAKQAAGTGNGYSLKSISVSVSNGYPSVEKARYDFGSNGSTALESETGLLCNANLPGKDFVPGKNCSATSTEIYELDLTDYPGYSGGLYGEVTLVTHSTKNNVLYYSSPEIENISINPATPHHMIISGTTHGASTFDKSVIGYALLHSGDDSTGEIVNFEQQKGAPMNGPGYDSSKGNFPFLTTLTFSAPINQDFSGFKGLAFFDARNASSALKLFS